MLGEATDQLSVKLGETMSGLLNASFGNAVEIIVGVAALLNGWSTVLSLFAAHDDSRPVENRSDVRECPHTGSNRNGLTLA